MQIKPLKQERKQSCGVAALRMMMLAHGKNVSEKELIKILGGLKSYGTTIVALANLVQKYGFGVNCLTYNKKHESSIVKYREPRMRELKQAIQDCGGVIVPVRSAILYNESARKRAGHMILVTGCRGCTVSYIDPWDGKVHDIDEDRFLFAWYNMAAENSAYLFTISLCKK